MYTVTAYFSAQDAAQAVADAASDWGVSDLDGSGAIALFSRAQLNSSKHTAAPYYLQVTDKKFLPVADAAELYAILADFRANAKPVA